MNDHTAAIVIVGAGIIGGSIAYHLAIRGYTNIIILEQAETEISGSSARSAAGVRHQFSSEVNVQLSRYSIERLKHFNEEVGGDSGLRQIGYLFLISDEAIWETYQRSVAMQQQLGVSVAALTPAEAADLIPGLEQNGLIGATYSPEDGFCDPHGVGTGYINRARSLGADLRRATPATGFQISQGRITAVKTPQGSINCDIVVNAAGSWAGEVAALAGLGVAVQPYRRNVYVTEPFGKFFPGTIPFTVDAVTGFWMRKEHDNVIFGMSNMEEPPSHSTMVDWGWLDTVLEVGLERFPILEHAGLAEKLCWAGSYEVTPDHMPILGRHPDMPNYIDASGFSGHGVMHSPATGMLIAEEIIDGRAHTINIDELRITRFNRREFRHEQNII